MQRYFAKEYKDKIILKDSDIHHIKNVMRMKVNDKIEVVYDNKLYICKIDNLSPIELSIISTIEEENKLNLNITIVIPLVKEQKMDLILQKLTELGVDKIIPVEMERSIVKLDKNREEKRLSRWINICKEASEQSKRTNIPTVERVMLLEEVSKLNYDIKLVASTKKNKLLNYYLQEVNNCAKIIVVIGPEGGISEREEELLNKNGFLSVSFGNLIFRVETATIYIASVLNYYSSTR